MLLVVPTFPQKFFFLPSCSSSPVSKSKVYVKIYKIIAFRLVGITRVIPVGSHDRHILSLKSKRSRKKNISKLSGDDYI